MMEQLYPIIALLGFGTASVLILPMLRISPIVGFILTGLALSHDGLHVIAHNETIHLLAELGVVFLLFDIGLHFSLRHVWRERKGIFVLGPLQMAVTTGLFFLGGAAFGLSMEINLVMAIGMALSSTAVVSQVLAEKGLQGSPISNRAIAVLIFQDIVAIFLLILVDIFVHPGDVIANIGLALLKCFISIALAITLGRAILGPLFRSLIKFENSEAFTMIALLTVLLTGAATGAVGLSLTLGAFLAGMVISETPFKHIIQTELRPFRSLLLSFFFFTVGMTIDLNVLLGEWLLVASVALGLSIIKATAIFGVFSLAKEPLNTSFQQATLMFQGSEFLFVVLAKPEIAEMLGAENASIVTAAVAISMAITSFIFAAGRHFSERKIQTETSAGGLGNITDQPRTVIVGMNEIGRTVARAMQYFSIPYLAIEHRYEDFMKGRLAGFPVIYGDRADMRFWETLGIEQFKIFVVANPDPEVSKWYAPIVRRRFPNLRRYVAVSDQQELETYQSLHDVVVMTAGIPKGLELAAKLLTDLGLDEEQIRQWMQKEQNAVLDFSGNESIY